MKAFQGGQATNDTIDAHTLAGWLRGGMLPQAAASPAARRATRDLLRRRRPLRRQRAARCAPSQPTNSPDHLPALGKTIAYEANRDGVAERFPEPAGPKSLEVDLALMGPDDHGLRDVERCVRKTATPHDAHTRDRRRTGPGIGESLSLVLLEERHDSQRCPRGQAFVSSGRLLKGAKDSAAKHSGTSGANMGPAYRNGAFSAAAVLWWRAHPAGQQALPRLEKKPSPAKALTGLAHPCARAVYDR
jgi:hypothetical protein